MRRGELVVDTVPDPIPGEGEVLVRTLACGICGSDLHVVQHFDTLLDTGQEMGTPFGGDLRRDMVMGHEFCAEVLELGPNTACVAQPGDRVVSMPVLPRNGALQAIGFSNEVPGGFGEVMVLAAGLVLPVPRDLATDYAALTEPMAVGVHAVAKARLEPDDASLVIGCGPVGLSIVAALKLRGAEPIVASDLSPMRRALAARMGAHVTVDPAARSPFEVLGESAAARPAVIFECVGAPGLIRYAMREAPLGARLVIAGVCLQEDAIMPIFGTNKELNVQFVLAYAPDEFAAALQAIADGRIQVEPLVTGKVSLAGVAQAFTALAKPNEHAKILVEPWRN
jgi:threonine dehydrogenase-like Zn-dependent dehydrogenase